MYFVAMNSETTFCTKLIQNISFCVIITSSHDQNINVKILPDVGVKAQIMTRSACNIVKIELSILSYQL